MPAPRSAAPTRPVSVPADVGRGHGRLALKGGTPVSDTPVPFMSPGLAPEDIEAATAVLHSGMLRAAKRCEELEGRFASLSDAKHAMACANGTCALQLAYESLLHRGDEVIVPAWTYIATASMLVARGCKPVFCDVDPETYQIDIADAANRITPRTTAIACTHLYGTPVDIDGVQALAQKHGLAVIYDAAQAHLARYTPGDSGESMGIGAFGDAVTYSFYATKNLGTGEGGLLTTNSDDTAHKIRLLRSHGETDKYLHECVGYNYRLNDIAGAIACSRLDRLQDETHRRQAAAKAYDAILGSIDCLHAPRITERAEPAWHLYTCRLDPDAFACTRDEFIEALRAEGVPTAVHYPRSLTRQPAFEHHVTDHPPVSDRLSSLVFCLPMHQDLTEAHIRTVGEALHKVAEAYRV